MFEFSPQGITNRQLSYTTIQLENQLLEDMFIEDVKIPTFKVAIFMQIQFQGKYLLYMYMLLSY